MNTIKKSLLVLIALAFFNTANAENSAKEKFKLLNDFIGKSIGFPAIEKTKGDSYIVLVSFDVNYYGDVEVIQVNAINEVFKDHVKTQLGQLDLSNYDDLKGETFNLKIRFVVK
jgi:hypothetical protein